MNIEQRKHSKNPQKQTSTFSDNLEEGMFQPRPFILQSKKDEEQESKQAGLETSLMQAERYGHNLSKINLASVPDAQMVQPKLRMGNLPGSIPTEANRPKIQSSNTADTGEVIQTARAKTPTTKKSRSKTSRSKTSQRRTQSGGIRKPPAKKPKATRSKQKQLENQAQQNPNKTPMQILEGNQNLLVGKDNPSKSGEHSPSVVNINKTTDNKMGVQGRDHYKHKQGQPVNSTIHENQIPTMHFQNISGKPIVPGKEAHSITTSLRAAAGVGEHTKQPFDQVLDKTLSAYPGAKLLSNNKPMKVDLRQKGANQSLVRHPVSPRIAQAGINIWMRNAVKNGQPSANIL